MTNPVIWHIAAWWPTEQKPGNGLFIKAHIESTLDYANHGIIYLKPVDTNWFFPSISIKKESQGFNTYIITVRTPVRRFGIIESLVKKAYKQAFKAIEKDIGQADIIHMHVRNHLTKWAIPGVLKMAKPVVLTEHFSFYHRGIHQLPSQEQKKEKKEIVHFFKSEKLKAILPVSVQLRDVLVKEFEANQEKTQVVPNIAEDCFTYAPKAPTKEVRIVLVAAWNPPKNPFLFFDALSMLDEKYLGLLRIDIIGHGTQVSAMKEYSGKILKNVNLVYHGFKPRGEIVPYLQQASFFCLPTDRENLPTVIVEALCCGCPVLSMNTNGIPEMVNADNGLLVPPKDVNAMTLALEEMITNKDSFDRAEISKKARSKYSSETVGNQIKAVYDSILGD